MVDIWKERAKETAPLHTTVNTQSKTNNNRKQLANRRTKRPPSIATAMCRDPSATPLLQRKRQVHEVIPSTAALEYEHTYNRARLGCRHVEYTEIVSRRRLHLFVLLVAMPQISLSRINPFILLPPGYVLKGLYNPNQ